MVVVLCGRLDCALASAALMRQAYMQVRYMDTKGSPPATPSQHHVSRLPPVPLGVASRGPAVGVRGASDGAPAYGQPASRHGHRMRSRHDARNAHGQGAGRRLSAPRQNRSVQNRPFSAYVV
jgi:hypothetical protein